MSNEYDNRRSFRVSETVYLKYELITEEEFKGGLSHYKIRLGLSDGANAKLTEIESRLGEAMFLLSKENEQISRCLTLLNDKLNLAISQVPAFREASSSLAKQPPQTCDVGADGLVFSSDKQMQIDDKLYFRFLLSSDNRYVETFASVVRLTDPPDTSNPAWQYGIGIEFNGMKPELREVLIQHMFNRESETLRMRRLKLEELEGWK